MPAFVDLIPTLHRIALSAFVGVTAGSMLLAVIRRIRLCRPLLVWHRSGPLGPCPLGPSLFLLLVAAAFGHAWWTGRVVDPVHLVGYPAGGIFWFAASWMSRAVVVTEYGIVFDVRQIDRAVVWSQVVDYFTTNRNGSPHLVLLYRDRRGRRRRLDLSVPRRHTRPLCTIVHRKLETRFRVPDDEETIDGLRRLEDPTDSTDPN